MSRILVLLLTTALLAGCVYPGGIAGSGKVITEEKEFTGFDKVEVGSAFTTGITQDEAFSIVIQIDENLARYLKVVQDGDTLKIYLDMGVSFSLRGNNTLQARITLPELTGLKLSGASRGTISGFKSAKELALEVSGASSLKGDIEAGDATLNVSGASNVTLKGAARNVDLEVSGASKADLADFAVADARVNLSGASKATVNAEGKLDVTASGASALSYLGHPTLGNVNTSGASTIRRK